MTRKRRSNKCVLCGKNPAEGWAWIGDDRYCHGDNDPDPTCYMRGQDQAYGYLSAPGRLTWEFQIIEGSK